MKYETKVWKIIEIYKNREDIQFPEYQRDPNVWDDKKKARLIDSMIKGIPIPALTFYKQNSKAFDCVDGGQRIQSIVSFFDGKLTVPGYGTVDTIQPKILQTIEDYKISSVLITDAKESELREMFIRLQIGAHLNAGEKLNATTGEMKNFVFKLAKSHPFFQKINIPSRRFSKEQVLAQICLNSISRQLKGNYQSARFEKLLAFFNQYDKLEKIKSEVETIKNTLDLLNNSFGNNAKEFTNRALVLSAYLFVEKLSKEGDKKRVAIFPEFYLKFIKILKEQSSKGLDYDKKYREIVDFYTYVTQAAFEPYAIKNRDSILEKYFKIYKKDGKI